jgi:DNA-directed RNA polymerase subunit RPC12/RpoP
MRLTETARGRGRPFQPGPRSAGSGLAYVCPKCGLVFSFPRRTAPHDLVCPECGTRLVHRKK